MNGFEMVATDSEQVLNGTAVNLQQSISVELPPPTKFKAHG